MSDTSRLAEIDNAIHLVHTTLKKLDELPGPRCMDELAGGIPCRDECLRDLWCDACKIAERAL